MPRRACVLLALAVVAAARNVTVAPGDRDLALLPSADQWSSGPSVSCPAAGMVQSSRDAQAGVRFNFTGSAVWFSTTLDSASAGWQASVDGSPRLLFESRIGTGKASNCQATYLIADGLDPTAQHMVEVRRTSASASGALSVVNLIYAVPDPTSSSATSSVPPSTDPGSSTTSTPTIIDAGTRSSSIALASTTSSSPASTSTPTPPLLQVLIANRTASESSSSITSTTDVAAAATVASEPTSEVGQSSTLFVIVLSIVLALVFLLFLLLVYLHLRRQRRLRRRTWGDRALPPRPLAPVEARRTPVKASDPMDDGSEADTDSKRGSLASMQAPWSHFGSI